DVETHVLPDGSCLLYDPVARQGHVLDATGALAWDYCDGTLGAEAIADEIAALMPQVAALRDEVLGLLSDFAARGLLLPAPEPRATAEPGAR
ncbi:MAG TPA: PqqD family peptide modification chaperone, partial [Ktedonobacterales bacterium]|nr:PqqD family peptide modification chaperone [Ktedonobacterales bacterium]